MKRRNKPKRIDIEIVDYEHQYEVVKALDLGGALYEIDSIPRSVETFSVSDIVTGHLTKEGSLGPDVWCLVCTHVINRSGRKLLRTPGYGMHSKDGLEFTPMQQVRKMGCSVHEGDPMSIDIPAEVSVDSITDILDEAGIDWGQVA